MATLFVGDIHGCAAELEEVLGQAGVSQGRDRVFLTGDAFSRGPDPARVWEVIRSVGARMVLGNHDARLLQHLRQAADGRDLCFNRPDHRITFDQLAPVADDLLPWLESCPLFIQGSSTGELAAQGGLPPNDEAPAAGSLNHPSGESERQRGLPPKDKAPNGGQPNHPSEEFARQGGLLPKDKAPNGGFVLVHAGLNPDKGLAGTTRKEFLTIRTWPPTDGLQGPRWHDAVGPDCGLVVFGHDAPGGLVIRHSGTATSRPYLVGLDSGCVYGGLLSGYLLEENRTVQVKSRQPPL